MDSALTNTEQLTSIMRIVRWAAQERRFALIFANCNVLEDQNRYIGDLKQRCTKIDVTMLTLELWSRDPIKNLRAEIKAQLQQQFDENLPSKLAIQISGLELSILLDPDERFPAILQTLNLGRESYRAELPYPIIFWLPEYAIVKLANVAPDFWSVRDGSYTFLPGTPGVPPGEIFPGETPGVQGLQNLTQWRDKSAQIPLIERILQSEARENPAIYADLKLKLGDAYLFLGKLDRARSCYAEALRVSRESDDLEREGSAHNGLGLVCAYSDDPANARQHFETFIRLRQRQGKAAAQAVGYNHLGLAYDQQGDYEQAIACYERALAINRETGKRQAEGDVLGNLGLVLRKMQRFEDALNAHFNALKISEELDNQQSKAKDLGNIGLVYFDRGDYKNAINYYLQSLQLSQRLGNKLDVLNQRLNLGHAFRELQDFDSAVDHYTSAYALAGELGSESLQFTASENLVRLFGAEALRNEEHQEHWIEAFLNLIKKATHPTIRLQAVTTFLTLCQSEELCHKQRPWLVELEPIIKHLDLQVDQTEQRMACYEALITIYHRLDFEQQEQEYQQKLNELKRLRQLYIWLAPGVVEPQESTAPLMLDINQTYTLFSQFRRSLPEASWLFQRTSEQSLQIPSHPAITGRESFKVSAEPGAEEETIPTEAPGQASEMLVERPSEEVSQAATLKKEREMAAQVPVGEEPGIEAEYPREIEHPAPEPAFEGDVEAARKVELRLESEHLRFDEPEQMLLLPEFGESNVVRVSFAPQITGEQQLEIRIRSEDEVLQDRFAIRLWSWEVFEFETVTVNARGEIVKRTPGRARQFVEDLGKGVNLEMVYIPGGTFLMGSPKGEQGRYDDESPQHEVRIASFLMSKYPITQAQWEAVMGNNPSYFKGPNRPVENVSWNDTQEFLKRLNEKLGRTHPHNTPLAPLKGGIHPPTPLKGGIHPPGPPQGGNTPPWPPSRGVYSPLEGGRGVYRLPSEAEWEYACRARTTTPFYFGETITTDLANYDGNYTYASESKGTYRWGTTDVGIFPPNAFGLFDMHGNVWEWVADPWHENYKGAPTDGSVWEESGGSNRVLRGGSWLSDPQVVRSAYRGRDSPSSRADVIGFRLVRTK